MFAYPRLFVCLFASSFAGLITFILYRTMHGNSSHLSIYISGAMISSGFWAPIITKRIVDKEQTCGYIRAALLGFASALVSVITVGLPIGWEFRLIEFTNGFASMSQTLKHMFVDDIATNIGGGLFALLFCGWYLAPMGGVAGIVLLELRRIYHKEQEAPEE